MNKGKQATLFQSWGSKKKETKKDAIIDLCDGLDEDDDEMLAEAMERSIHEFNDNVGTSNTENGNQTEPSDVCNISIGAEGFPGFTQGLTQRNVPPGFDKVAGKLWIYPTNYPVREYQYNIVGQALLKNTMVTLPTGLGKTFVAAVVMYNYYRWYPQGKVVFMAPTKPLVAQQIEACYNIMGIPQDDTAEMTGTMAPTERRKVWMEKRVFFLTPQVIMNDLSRGTCPAVDVRCLVIDEAHKATGNHAYCQVVRELIKYTSEFRILALSATPGGDIKAVQQVLANLLISHIELRTEESPDIKQYSHERKVEKIVVPLGDELTNVKKKYIQIMDVIVNRLKRQGVLYKRDTTSLSKFLILKAREDFRQNPPPNLQRNHYGSVEGDFALAMSLYHGFELLQLHGSRSLYNYLDGILHGDKAYGRTRTELTRNQDFNDLMDILREKFAPSEVRLTQSSKKPLVTGHPKMERLEQVVLDHFNTYNNGVGETRVMIFSQYRDSVSEITNILKQHHPLVKVMSFIGQSSAGKSTKGFTQKEQLKVMKDFREGGYNTLVSTCVGEEGLDIGDVDLIICFDAHKSPIRLVQRMGRTGRKREGRIVMLVTEGKEEQIYNQSQYSKKSIHKAILNSAKTLHFYQNNPTMLPDDWKPQCHKMFITVSKKFKPTKVISTSNQNKITSMLASNVADIKSSGDGGITKEEYEELKEYMYMSGEPSAKTLPQGGALVCLGEDLQMPSEKNLSLSKWLPWQNRLQPTFLVDHSKQTTNFVEMVQFLELQEALDPNEDNYGQEMEMFLNDADILKPGQQEEDGGNIRQFFVTSDGKGKQIQKKRSLLNVNKPRRSDQLPDFEAFVLSGESDEELPAIFDKNDNGAINNTDVIIKSYKNLSGKEEHSNGNKSVKKNRKKRNSSGNSSIVEVIADTDVNDFIEHVDNLSVINEETQENSQDKTVISMVKTDTEQVEMEQESISSIVQSSDFKINMWSISEGILRECANFTQLLPTFFSLPSCANVTSDTTDINKYECIVPDAPSLNELDVLVESISHMTTLPEIDMAKLVWEWEKEKKENANGRVETFKSCLKDQISPANTVGNAGNRSTTKPEFQHKTPKENSENKFENSFLNNNKARNIQPSRLSLFSSDNNSFNISSDFETPIKLTNKITSCNVSSVFENPSVKAMKENINMEVSVVNPDNIQRNPVSPKCDEDNTEMQVEPFSDSDDSFLDTQANFMLTNDELLADISCDECNQDSHVNSNVDHSTKHATKDVINKHHTDKPGGSSARPNALDFSSSDLCKSADGSLFDDSFMNSSVLEAVKTPAVKHQSQSESPEFMGRNTPTQFTFTQALACVHDSDSMDRVLVTSSTSDAKGLSPKREVCNEGHFTLIKKHQTKHVDEKNNFTKNEECENSSFVKKQQPNDNSLNRSQCDLINDMFNMDNTEDFSDAEEETEMPLFDLGFDVDDEIIPPSPCLSQTLSQKSILKNLNQSVLSSRKSLSFLCDKSKIYEDKNRTSIKPVLTPTTEEFEDDHDDKDDSKIEEHVSQGFHLSQDQTTENVPEVLNISKCAHETTVNKEQTKMEDDDDQQLGHMFLHDDFNVDDLQEDFEMIPTSPVLSGKRPSSQRQVILPNDALKSPVDAKNKSVATSVDSPSLDDSFVVRKKRRKALIIDSPGIPHCQEKEEFDDFKTPLRPVNLKNKQKFSTSSSEEESILRKKKCAKSVSFLIDEFDDDFENEAVSSETKKRNSNPVTINDVKISSGKTKRKSKSPANPFLIDEAEVSEDEEVSTDEEDGSDMEHMEDSFVSEGCTQLSQGQHEELHAIYLKSVRSPAIQGGRFKLKYDYDDNIDVYSQVPQDEESQYYDDSFVDDEVEEHTLLDGHEITILDKDNILDNDSYVGPRTRWSKPARREKVIQPQKTKKKRVKRITDSSSEDEGEVHSKSVISPEQGSKNLLTSPAISVNPARSNIRNRRQLIISSDEEQDPNQESDSSEIMCSLKTRLANKHKTVDSSSSDHSDSNSQVSSLKEKEERILRQKEKQEEFKRILAAKKNVELTGSNSIKPSAKVHDKTTFSEDPQLTVDDGLLLNTTRHSESKPVIIVDSREINGAQDIVSALRFQHGVNVIAAQLDSCDYVVSVRMGIDRKQWAEFSNGSNRAKMTERVQEMCDFYDRPCVIIEKDKIKGDEKSRVLHWTKYVDKTLVQLIQSKVTLFFTENQTETASIIAGLCQLESRKNCAISCPINLSAEQQNRMKFFRSIPHLSYIHCLFLCNNFMTVAKFLCSDINTIMEKGKMTMERATEVYNYIKRMFDTQMLPSSYG